MSRLGSQLSSISASSILFDLLKIRLRLRFIRLIYLKAYAHSHSIELTLEDKGTPLRK